MLSTMFPYPSPFLLLLQTSLRFYFVEFNSPPFSKKIASRSELDNPKTLDMLDISEALNSLEPLSLLYNVSLNIPVFSAIATIVIPESSILFSNSFVFNTFSPPYVEFNSHS